MSPTGVEQRRHPGWPCSELAELIAAAGLVPERAGDTQANALLGHDGAVILTGRTDEPVELVAAAAAILGTRLRRLFPIRRQAADGAVHVVLHVDGANVVVDIDGRSVRLRDPDEDYLLMLCQTPAPCGGDSIVIDGDRLLDQMRTGHSDLHAFQRRRGLLRRLDRSLPRCASHPVTDVAALRPRRPRRPDARASRRRPRARPPSRPPPTQRPARSRRTGR